jgi:hypothetical protein
MPEFGGIKYSISLFLRDLEQAKGDVSLGKFVNGLL